MNRLVAHKKDLYQLRFSPMCKPAGEVANLTQLESHTTRARTMMMWRIALGCVGWGPREVELLYESTLDSISCAFDVFHYPIHRYVLDARADVWEAGLAPACVREAVEASARPSVGEPRGCGARAQAVLLAGEVAQLGDDALLKALEAALKAASVEAVPWVVQTGALAYALGAREVATAQAQRVAEGVRTSGVQTIVADGPETAWALTRIYPALGVGLPEGVAVRLLAEVLVDALSGVRNGIGGCEQEGAAAGALCEACGNGTVFVHDSRPAYLISAGEPGHTAILPGYTEDEVTFGQGVAYEAPRALLDALGARRVWGVWTRALARTSGADDGLWLTYPKLAAGLAAQRLDYAEHLGARLLVTDSPLGAAFLSRHATGRRIQVRLLAELFCTNSK